MDLQRSSKKERAAAEQEAKLLSTMKHPNIVAYRESFEENGFLYIVMGFCEGGDLYTRLKEQKGTLLEEKQLVQWFVQITMALQVIFMYFCLYNLSVIIFPHHVIELFLLIFTKLADNRYNSQVSFSSPHSLLCFIMIYQQS